ncbi:MAG: helix-turn-helix domain-containing protein [Lachnospiraceae bacterium]|nr:helix-turn-helix domain-containing protein [Lachnospiraceae bacterium]MCM1236211.1 helix-turn-helix domain-containing protein [Ruminococcus flavefaciens]
MEEMNIFKKLRTEQTTKTKTVNRRGKEQEIKTHLSQKELAEEMNIDQSSISKAENGKGVTLGIIEAYHDYFGIPYDTLCGKTDTEYSENININLEYGLTDKALDTIKSLSPVARSMLNVFLSKGAETENFFYQLADVGYSMVSRLAETSPDKDHLNKGDKTYQSLRQVMADFFLEYMHTMNMGDLLKVLVQIEKQEQLFTEYQCSEEHIKELEEYMQESH